MLTIESIIGINKKFHSGKLVNRASLEFAVSAQNKTKNWLVQLAYLVRAILIDHSFEDGNKRTTVAIVLVYLEAHKLAYDPYKLDDIIISITKKNIKDLKKIGRLIKNVIR